MQFFVDLPPDTVRRVHSVVPYLILKKLFEVVLVKIVFHLILDFYHFFTPASRANCGFGFSTIFFFTRMLSNMLFARVYWLRLVLSAMSSIPAISRWL